MATANPLDEFLNSEVDEYAISALVGSLTNELASPTSKESLQQKSASNSQKNHVDAGQTNVPAGARAADVQTVMDGQNAGLNVNSGLHAGNPGTVNKTIADNRLLGLNTVVTGPNATGGASIVTINNTAGSQTGHVSVAGSGRIGQIQIQTCRGSDSPSPNSAGSPAPVSNPLLQQMRSVPSPNTNSGISRTPPPATIITMNQNNNNKAQILRDQMDTDSIGVSSNVPKTQFVIKQDPQQVKIPISINTTRGSPVAVVTGVPQRQSPLTANTSMTSQIASSVAQSRSQTVVRTSVTTSPHVQIMNSPRMTVSSTQLKTLAPRLVNTGALRIQQPQQIIAPRPGTNTITIPTGMVPPNAVFIKNEQGQIVMVTPSSSGPVPSQASGGATTVSTMGQKIVIQPRSQMSSTIIRHPQTISSAATPPTIRQAIPQTVMHQSQQGSTAQAQFENVKKCKNFLTTLIKLASSQPKKTVENVKTLIQGLIDGRVEPEMFTTKLQIELKSSPQPYLVPFLKKSLPLLRQSLSLGKMTIEGVTAPLLATSRASTGVAQSQVMNQLQVGRASNNRLAPAPQQMSPLTLAQQRLPAKNIGVNKNLFKPGSQVLATHHPSPLQLKEKRKYDSLKDDDDINDVATMGGVNLTEESRNILASSSEIFGAQTRSCKDEYFLNTAPLLNRISNIAKKHGLSDVPTEVAHLVSHASQERLRNLVEKLGTISEHRLELHKMDQRFEATDESRLQMKFLEELDKLEKKRHEDSEREILLRAAKSRSKHEDPEQLKLKQKAKELQQMEMEEVRQREANLTALAAIGPRKKRKTEPVNTSQGPDVPLSAAGSSSSSSQRNALRPRAKRVNLRDLIFLLEQERESAKSKLLYQTYLK
ncbi:transcription initiation factor TFIID subunit 4-like [Lineus longissimus]|uniref:transcription initiation factor TFIID subunit 4-like n=1 Tax=Lineus longissimus TaxID=88925 RepID=UPI002B4DDBD2